MKRVYLKACSIVPAAALLLGGCAFFTGGPASTSDSLIPDHLKGPRVVAPPVGDHHAYGPVGTLAAGRWAKYRITAAAGPHEITLGVVRRIGDAAWIEIVEEGVIRRASLRHVDSRGKVLQAFYREIATGGASARVDQPVIAGGDEPGEVPEEITAEAATIDLLGRQVPGTTVRERYVDEALGRILIDESSWSPEAPRHFAEREGAGLVRRLSRRNGTEIVLASEGSGYQPLIPPPSE